MVASSRSGRGDNPGWLGTDRGRDQRDSAADRTADHRRLIARVPGGRHVTGRSPVRARPASMAVCSRRATRSAAASNSARSGHRPGRRHHRASHTDHGLIPTGINFPIPGTLEIHPKPGTVSTVTVDRSPSRPRPCASPSRTPTSRSTAASVSHFSGPMRRSPVRPPTPTTSSPTTASPGSLTSRIDSTRKRVAVANIAAADLVIVGAAVAFAATADADPAPPDPVPFPADPAAPPPPPGPPIPGFGAPLGAAGLAVLAKNGEPANPAASSTSDYWHRPNHRFRPKPFPRHRVRIRA